MQDKLKDGFGPEVGMDHGREAIFLRMHAEYTVATIIAFYIGKHRDTVLNPISHDTLNYEISTSISYLSFGHIILCLLLIRM
jgi:hypothetical protein